MLEKFMHVYQSEMYYKMEDQLVPWNLSSKKNLLSGASVFFSVHVWPMLDQEKTSVLDVYWTEETIPKEEFVESMLDYQDMLLDG